MPDCTQLHRNGLLDGLFGGQRGVRGGSPGGACDETGPVAYQTDRWYTASANGSRQAQRRARRLACGVSADGSVETGPASCPVARSSRSG